MIDALAKALRLGRTEHEHLFDLATRAASMMPPQLSVPNRQSVAPGAELLLERLRPYPARVLNRTMDNRSDAHDWAASSTSTTAPPDLHV